MILREGTFLQDRYEVIAHIGSGGMSDVYKCLDHKLNRQVAIKVLKDEFSSDESFVSKFKMEAQAAAGLTHPNVVNVYDVVDEGELHYIVMELVEGLTLKNFIAKKGTLSVKEAIGISIQMVQGIGAAHEQHIVHRDIKPQNIIISADGKVKVADFGIARAVSSETLTSDAMGSVHYISPEQARGESSDERSDIYSLGITMFEMVTGRPPFDGDTSVSIAISQIEDALPIPSLWNPDITPAFEQIILRCCEKRPERRYQLVQEVGNDLRRALVNPNANAGAAVDEDPYSSTRVLTQEELGAINAHSKGKYKKNSSSANEKSKSKKSSNREKASGFDKFITVAGILLAVAIVAALFVLIGKATGSFGGSLNQVTELFGDKADASDSETVTKCPDVRGLSYALAEEKLTDSSLQIRVSEEVYSAEAAADQIISQDPQPDTVIDKYSTVYVVVSKGNNVEDLSQLNLIGASFEEGRSILREKGYEVRKEEEFSEYKEGLITGISPTQAEKNSVITLVVSKGRDSDTTEVPSILGQPQDAAMELLLSSSLAIGDVTYIPSKDVPAGCVVSQSQNSGTVISKGAAIGFVVSSGPDVPVEQYIGSIQSSYNLNDLKGPSHSTVMYTIMIRLHQIVEGEDVYTTLMEPRTVTGDTTIPIKYDYIEGAPGVEEGDVEVVNVEDETVLKSFTVPFFKQ